jgi:hypothetical protein
MPINIRDSNGGFGIDSNQPTSETASAPSTAERSTPSTTPSNFAATAATLITALQHGQLTNGQFSTFVSFLSDAGVSQTTIDIMNETYESGFGMGGSVGGFVQSVMDLIASNPFHISTNLVDVTPNPTEAVYEDASGSTIVKISYSAAERKALSDRFGGGGTNPRAIIMKALKSLFEDLSSITAIEIDYIFKKSPSQPFEKDDLSSFDEDEAEQHVTISTTMEKG